MKTLTILLLVLMCSFGSPRTNLARSDLCGRFSYMCTGYGPVQNDLPNPRGNGNGNPFPPGAAGIKAAAFDPSPNPNPNRDPSTGLPYPPQVAPNIWNPQRPQGPPLSPLSPLSPQSPMGGSPPKIPGLPTNPWAPPSNPSGPQGPPPSGGGNQPQQLGGQVPGGLGIGSGFSSPFFGANRGLNVNPTQGVVGGTSINAAGAQVGQTNSVNFGGLPGLNMINALPGGLSAFTGGLGGIGANSGVGVGKRK